MNLYICTYIPLSVGSEGPRPASERPGPASEGPGGVGCIEGCMDRQLDG